MEKKELNLDNVIPLDPSTQGLPLVHRVGQHGSRVTDREKQQLDLSDQSQTDTQLQAANVPDSSESLDKRSRWIFLR